MTVLPCGASPDKAVLEDLAARSSLCLSNALYAGVWNHVVSHQSGA